MKMNESIFGLVDYAARCELIEEDDRLWALNRLLEVMGLDGVEPATASGAPLHVLLETLTEDAVARGVCEDNQVARDLFDTRLMGVLTPAPREVREQFRELYRESPWQATDWFYKFSQDTTSAATASRRIRNGSTKENTGRWTSPSISRSLRRTPAPSRRPSSRRSPAIRSASSARKTRATPAA